MVIFFAPFGGIRYEKLNILIAKTYWLLEEFEKYFFERQIVWKKLKLCLSSKLKQFFFVTTFFVIKFIENIYKVEMLIATLNNATFATWWGHFKPMECLNIIIFLSFFCLFRNSMIWFFKGKKNVKIEKWLLLLSMLYFREK